ncbi:hypothetical protein [Neptunicella sp.]|uniref:hypothetical protein n=1 Tax=Neptunicella sp. TaxID=2125986 RepID=UPI003F68FBCC
MLIDTDKVTIDSRAIVSKDVIDKEAVGDYQVELSEITLSQTGQDINDLYQKVLQVAKEHPSPIYISVDKRFELLEKTASMIAAKSDISYTSEQIHRASQDVGKELNITEIPPGDISAGGGNVFSFLSQEDKTRLGEAYQHALDNNSDLKDVNTVAFTLAIAKFREEKIASGTIYGTFSKEERESLYELNNKLEAPSDEIKQSGRDFVEVLKSELEGNDLFSSNPFLKTLIQRDSIFDILEARDPDYFNKNIRKKFFT